MTKISQSVEVTESHNRHITVEIPRFGNRWEVQHILWFARELEVAVAAGMPKGTEVKIDSTMSAKYTVVEEIPVPEPVVETPEKDAV